MSKRIDKFRQYTSMMTEAGQKMQENMTNFDRSLDRKTLAHIVEMLAVGVAVVAIIHIIHLVTLFMK